MQSEHVYRIVPARRFGLDLWLITKDNRTIHSFFSREYAVTVFDRIKKTIERGEVY